MNRQFLNKSFYLKQETKDIEIETIIETLDYRMFIKIKYDQKMFLKIDK